jgi:hypothetical protein
VGSCLLIGALVAVFAIFVIAAVVTHIKGD